MSTVMRILGWVLMLPGVAILALVGIFWLSGEDIVRPAGLAWAEVNTFSLTQTQYVVQEFLSPNLWDSYIVPLLEQPTWLAMAEVSALLLVFGILFLQLGHRRRKPGDRFRQMM